MQLSDAISSKLRDFQIEPANWLLTLLANQQNVVDFSDCGIGKSYIAMAVAAALRLPTLVISPKIGVTAWNNVATHFGEEVTVTGWEQLRTGKTGLGRWDYPRPSDAVEQTRWYKCCNCQCSVGLGSQNIKCFARHDGIHCLETKKSPWNYGKFRFHPGVKFIIADEIHRAAARDSLNSEMLIAARRQNILMLGLSATPGNSPLQFKAIGYMLGLHGCNDFWQWAHRYGCRRLPGMPGIHFAVGAARQVEIMQRLHHQIIPSRGVRLRVDDIPNFPELEITTELVDIDAPEQIDALYAEMKESMDRLDIAAANDVDPSLPLTGQLRQRQAVELLKIPALTELTEKYRDAGFSVVIFLNFSDSLKELSRRLKTKAIIDGKVTGARRDGIINSFQRNQEPVLLVNSRAGGENCSLHDLNGDFPRMGIISPGFDARNFRQICGRLRREGGKSIARYKVVLAARSVEEKIKKSLDNKLTNLDSLLDGDFIP